MGEMILWPGWETVRIIGRGSFGTVYEIRREVFGHTETAALKVISIPESAEELEELRNEGYDAASISSHYKGYLEEIVREYSLMLDLKGNSNVVYCDDLQYMQHSDGIGWDICIKMELLAPLKKALGQTYSEEQVVRLGTDMCRALVLCHKENIVHRDIKPDNVFVSKNGDYKLGDFGVAKVTDKTATGTKIGTYEYMSPEVYHGQHYGHGADLYSLGLVLYWMMNDRRTPFLPAAPRIPSASEKEAARICRFSGAAIPPPVNGSEALKQVVLKACAYDPQDRYRSAQEMMDALLSLDKGVTPEPVVHDSDDAWWDDGETVGPFNKGGADGCPSGVRELASTDKDDDSACKKDLVCVRFLDIDQRVISTKQYIKGAPVQIPKPPARPINNGMKQVFAGWTPVVSKTAEQHTDYTATYQMVAVDNTKKWMFFGGCVAVVALCMLLCVFLLVGPRTRHTPDYSDNHQDSTDSAVVSDVKEYTISEMNEVLSQVSWSDWVETIPSDVNTDDYVVQSKLVYSEAPALFYDADSVPSPDLTVCYTFLDYQEEFSPWQKEQVSPSDTRMVETRTIYYYREGVSKKTVNAQRVTVTYMAWDKTWKLSGADGTTPVSETKTRQVKVETEYRYKDLIERASCSDSKAWSPYADSVIQPSHTTNVRFKILYRYALRPEGVITVGMKNFVQSFNYYSGRFIDVDSSKWYGSSKSTCIRSAVEIGALLPTEYLCFRPEENLTINEAIRAAVAIHRIYNGGLGEMDPTEKAYVSYAEEHGLIEPGKYSGRLNQPATRGDFAYIMRKALPESELPVLNKVAKITDMSTTSAYYDAAYLFASAGIIVWPEAESVFRPNQYLSRAEAATMIERLAYSDKRFYAN